MPIILLTGLKNIILLQIFILKKLKFISLWSYNSCKDTHFSRLGIMLNGKTINKG